MKILGLDISTSQTGYTILTDNFEIMAMGNWNTSNCRGFWKKVDYIEAALDSLLSAAKGLDDIYIEESLMHFSARMSSAATIIALSKFNALVSYMVRDRTGKDPIYIPSTTARKTVGVKLLQKSKCGLSHKEQTMMWAINGPLADIEFPKTKKGIYAPGVADRIDSYVIARAGMILNIEGKTIVKKQKKK